MTKLKQGYTISPGTQNPSISPFDGGYILISTWHEYVQKTGKVPDWPYPVNYGKEHEVVTDVLIIGGGCVEECPRPGAITMLHPTQHRISMNWKRKDTSELFRIGMKNPPPPNTRPPSGG